MRRKNCVQRDQRESYRSLGIFVFCIIISITIVSTAVIAGAPQKVWVTPTVDWEKVYFWDPTFDCESQTAAFEDLEQTTDGGLILAGSTRVCLEDPDAAYRGWLVKTNPKGIITWMNVSIPRWMGAYMAVEQTSDGGFIVYGRFRIHTDLTKYSQTGEREWVTDFAHGTSYKMDVDQTLDGGYVLVTYSSDVHMIRLDALGNELWRKSYDYYSVHTIEQLSDETIVFAGEYLSSGLLVKTDSQGNILWQKNYPTGAFVALQVTRDGGYILCGTYNSGSGNQLWLMKTDASGNVVFDQKFNTYGDTLAFDVRETKDRGFVAIGNIPGAIYIVRTDNAGSMLWEMTITGQNIEGKAIVQTKDGGYAIAGKKDVFVPAYNAYTNGGYLVKLTKDYQIKPK